MLARGFVLSTPAERPYLQMSIIISKNGTQAQRIDRSDFDKEDYLQNYIHQNPESIPVYEIEEDKRLFVAARELSTESGPIDALAVDKDGDIYIVETKLFKNPDKRTVVAQALDYGAALWKHTGDFGEFLTILDEKVRSKFQLSFSEKVKEFFRLDDEQTGLLLGAMARNLKDGNLKFVILMDSLDDRLKDLIVYVNQNSQFDIFAVQMEYYKFKEYEIMIPKLYGAEVKKDVGVSGGSGTRVIKKWGEKEFLEDLEKRLSGYELEAVKKLYIFCRDNSDDLNFGSGSGAGAINPIFNKISLTHRVLGLKANGRLNFSIAWVESSAGTKEQKELLAKLRDQLKSIGIEVPLDESLNLAIEEWQDKVDKIIVVIKELIQT